MVQAGARAPFEPKSRADVRTGCEVPTLKATYQRVGDARATGRLDMATHRERLHELLDVLPEDRLALAETALTVLAMPDDESVINSDRAALAAAEQDPEKIGHALAGYRKRQGWTHEDLAAFLGLALNSSPRCRTSVGRASEASREPGLPGSGIYALAEAHGQTDHRLFEAIEDRPDDA